MRCMCEELPAIAPARSHHDLLLPGGSAQITARGMRSGEGSSRARVSNHRSKLHAISPMGGMSLLRESGCADLSPLKRLSGEGSEGNRGARPSQDSPPETILRGFVSPSHRRRIGGHWPLWSCRGSGPPRSMWHGFSLLRLTSRGFSAQRSLRIHQVGQKCLPRLLVGEDLMEQRAHVHPERLGLFHGRRPVGPALAAPRPGAGTRRGHRPAGAAAPPPRTGVTGRAPGAHPAQLGEWTADSPPWRRSRRRWEAFAEERLLPHRGRPPYILQTILLHHL